MRTATALRSMSGAGRSGYGPPLSWKVVSEVQAATHRQWHSGGQAFAGYSSVGSQEARVGGWSCVPPCENCCWWGSFVTMLPACDVHIKIDIFGWGNGIVRLQARSDEGGSQPRVMH